MAAEVASRGKSVVLMLIDCDPQGSANHWSQPGNLPMRVQHRPVSLKTDIDPLSKTIRELMSKTVDFLVLDSPPHLDAALGAVIGLPDLAVLPCGPSGLGFDRNGRDGGAGTRDPLTARGDGRPLITLVPNRVDLRT